MTVTIPMNKFKDLLTQVDEIFEDIKDAMSACHDDGYEMIVTLQEELHNLLKRENITKQDETVFIEHVQQFISLVNEDFHDCYEDAYYDLKETLDSHDISLHWSD